MQLLFYYDDFKLTSNDSTNIAICYLVLLNLPYWLQSSRDEINLILVTTKATLSEIFFESFLEYFIEDIFRINHNPIKLSNGFTVKVQLKASAADNEGNNRLMGVSRGFSTGRSIRYCTLSAKELQELGKNLRCVDCRVNNENACSRTNADGPRERPVFSDENVNESVRRSMPAERSFRQLTSDNTFFFAVDTFHDFCSNGVFARVLEPILTLYFVETNGNGIVDWQRFRNLIDDLLVKYKAINHRNGTIKGKIYHLSQLQA